MKINLPLTGEYQVTMGAHRITVRVVPPTDPELSHEHGQWVPGKLLVLINSHDPPSMKLSTLIHELLHAAEMLYEIEITHRDLNIAADAVAQALLTVSRP